ncbi:MAG: hypothetical protein AAGM22_19460 [Acidobacteriota bacterium]
MTRISVPVYILLAVVLLLGATASTAQTTATRSAPYPNYEVGGPASLVVTTNPAQPYAAVYQFRTKNGQPDNGLVGYTDGSGRFEIHISSLPGGIEGAYTNERYAVGTPGSPKSSALNFTIAPQGGISVGCGCEHFASQYDQFCEADVAPSTAPSGGVYQYTWTANGGYFPSPPGPFSPTVVALCANAASRLSVSVEVDLVFNGIVVSSASRNCSSGTPICG